MTAWDHVLGIGTASTSLGGAVLAQATQSPTITAGAIALSAIGVLSLWIRAHYALSAARLDTVRIRTELEIYRRLCARDHRCPFTPGGEPACTQPDQINQGTYPCAWPEVRPKTSSTPTKTSDSATSGS